MSQDELIENVKTWLTIDNDIKKLQKAVKDKRKEKKELTENLVNIMNQRDIDCMNTAQGQLIKTTKKTKAPLSKKHLLASLGQYFKGDQRMIDELSKFIMESRAEKEKESIRRKIKKNKN